MLTPKFKLSQDDSFVYLHLYIPHIKLSEVECHIQDDEFYFYSVPYYLRLHLPGNIVDDEKSKSTYNSDTGALDVRISKEKKGEVFEGLDLLTKLLTPKKLESARVSGGIEVISSQCDDVSTPEPACEEKEVGSDLFESCDAELSACIETDDWFVTQELEDPTSSSVLSSTQYGFAFTKTTPLDQLTSELTDMLDLKNPDSFSLEERRKMRVDQENEGFSCEHYLSDIFDDEVIQELVRHDFPRLTGVTGQEVECSDSEQEKLMQLPRREYIIDDCKLPSTYLALVDLMFAYSYDFRFTHGEASVESDWTICKLSATLAWLDSFQNLRDVVVSCARRSLTFPLYRNWTLFEKVLSDVKCIFQMGKVQILKCLLSIQSILSRSEMRYPLNDIFVTDYCVWIQTADVAKIHSLSEALNKLTISKEDVGLRLEEMEEDARKLLENEDYRDEPEEDGVESLIASMDNVVRISEDTDCDSDDNSDSDSDDTSDTDTSDSDTDSLTDTSDSLNVIDRPHRDTDMPHRDTITSGSDTLTSLSGTLDSDSSESDNDRDRSGKKLDER